MSAYTFNGLKIIYGASAYQFLLRLVMLLSPLPNFETTSDIHKTLYRRVETMKLEWNKLKLNIHLYSALALEVCNILYYKILCNLKTFYGKMKNALPSRD